LNLIHKSSDKYHLMQQKRGTLTRRVGSVILAPARPLDNGGLPCTLLYQSLYSMKVVSGKPLAYVSGESS
jgi:hypothetical protein